MKGQALPFDTLDTGSGFAGHEFLHLPDGFGDTYLSNLGRSAVKIK